MPFADRSTKSLTPFLKEPYTILLPSDDQIGAKLSSNANRVEVFRVTLFESNVNCVGVFRVRSNVQISSFCSLLREKARVFWSGEIRGVDSRPGSPTVLIEWPSRPIQVSWFGGR